MKKYKWIVLISISMGAIIISCKTQFSTTKDTYTATPSSVALEHGKDLVYTICAGCHYNRSVNKFIGTKIQDVPGIAGTVYSANLTNSKTHGLPPRYTDAELKYLFKTGIAKDGRFLSYMLRPNMSDGDINAIIVFLRSNDPAVAAADTTVGLTHFTFIGKAYMNMHADPVPYKTGIKRPSEDNPVALGGYLVDIVGCFHCHSESLTAINAQYPEQTKGYLAGGIKFKGENGHVVYASNITFDKNTGIGNYSKLQFRKAVKDGQAPNSKLRPPMPKFQRLTNAEVDAIYAYLQTVPAKSHKVGM
jgi:mono/diheme cytochrome c family protein